jgi:hypothetical protein
MGELVRFMLDDGGSVIVEIGGSETGIARASRLGDAVRSASTSFESSMSSVRDAAFSALRHFRDVPQPPDEVTIEFGVELSAEVGAVIAQTAANAHLQVTLAWRQVTSQPDTVSEPQSP